jgi:hypothetical protein
MDTEKLEDFVESGIVSAILALMFTAVTCYLWATQNPVTADLLAVNIIVVQQYIQNRDKKAVVAGAVAGGAAVDGLQQSQAPLPGAFVPEPEADDR